MVQLAGSQMTKISEGGQVDISLGGDEQIYADLHEQRNGIMYVRRCPSQISAGVPAGFESGLTA